MAEVKTDATFQQLNENKIEKSVRNSKAFEVALHRAAKGDFDKDVSDVTNWDLLKVTEKWSIRKQFSIEEGKEYFQLYKEVFYIENCHKYYFETVNPTVYRRIAKQHEHGDEAWAKAVSEHEKIDIVE